MSITRALMLFLPVLLASGAAASATLGEQALMRRAGRDTDLDDGARDAVHATDSRDGSERRRRPRHSRRRRKTPPAPAPAPLPAPLPATPASSAVEGLRGFIKEWAAANHVGEYSVLAGDGEGVRFVEPDPAVHRWQDVKKLKTPANYRRPQEVMSVGKWAAAASLGYAIKSHLKLFKWDDPVNTFITWWTKDPNDGRSRITFRHLMSHTSGLIADTHLAHAIGLQDYILHADCKWRDTSVNLEHAAKLAYDQTPSTINPPEPFRYGETHYLVAELAALRATEGARLRRSRNVVIDLWRDFFWRTWGSPLGLQKSMVRGKGEWKTKSYLKHDFQGREYAFFEDHRTHAYVRNPDAGSQLIVSPCGFSRFLTKMAKDGPEFFDSDVLDGTSSNTGFFQHVLGSYSMGHWVYDHAEPKVHHSLGAFGSAPIMSTLPNGQKFWIYLNVFEADNGMGKGAAFILAAAAKFREVFSMHMPELDTTSCVQTDMSGHPEYLKEIAEVKRVGTDWIHHKFPGDLRNPGSFLADMARASFRADIARIDEARANRTASFLDEISKIEQLRAKLEQKEEHGDEEEDDEDELDGEQEKLEEHEDEEEQYRHHTKPFENDARGGDQREFVVNAHGDEEQQAPNNRIEKRNGLMDEIVDADGNVRMY